MVVENVWEDIQNNIQKNLSHAVHTLKQTQVMRGIAIKTRQEERERRVIGVK